MVYYMCVYGFIPIKISDIKIKLYFFIILFSFLPIKINMMIILFENYINLFKPYIYFLIV